MFLFRWLQGLLFGPRVFASYADSDRPFIQQMVRLLRLLRGWVFFAPDSIRLGSPWESELRAAIKKCSFMVVFWCEHARSSAWVEREYSMALGLGKRVIPVLLDDTEVPDPLERQGIDLRGGGGHAPAAKLVSVAFFAPSKLVRDENLLRPGALRARAVKESGARSVILLAMGLAFVLLALLRPFPASVDT
jgi:hypothetical protein